MDAPFPNEELCRISEGLRTIIEWEIGPESVVRSNRQKYYSKYIVDIVNDDKTFLVSGSRAEGFEFDSSDVDVMVIHENILVIDNELRIVSNNITSFPIALLMETDYVQPGFTLLKCIRYETTATDDYMKLMLVLRGDSMYMSSERAHHISFLRGKSTVHGPCRSGVAYRKEYDYAFTLKCQFWPKQAHSFIYRSIRYGWPTNDEMIDICKDGCLLVPINDKKQSINDLEDLEWRISFSLAEKKLVYSMNHCQFLIYGLMKIFLNEVLKEIPETKTESGNVLCSYFMKTAVFWEISECVNQWSDRYFLDKFLKVFRRILKWIEEGYCPNFFIPEYNMFCGKIYGRRQKNLMLRLRSLYNEGIFCLSRCRSFGNRLFTMMNDQFQFHEIQIRVADVLAYWKEIAILSMIISNQCIQNIDFEIMAMTKALWHTAILLPTSPEMIPLITLRINYILHQIAFVLATHGAQNHTLNKMQYLLTKRARSILRKTQTSYCLGTIHQAVISYMNGEYHKTIRIIDHIQQKLQTQPYTYRWLMDPGIVMGCRQQGMSYEDIVKKFIIDSYNYNSAGSIPELALESTAHKQNCPLRIIIIPPFVFLYFLLILSYTQLNEPVERKAVLDELHLILYNDNNHHIQTICRAISWEILGICQQLCGKYVGAYRSYLNALNDKYNDFKEATIIRILSLLFDLHNHS